MTNIGKMEYERIKKVLWSGRDFKFSNIVLPNSKSNTGGIKHGIYERTYESKKYTDRHQLSALDLAVGEYYSFEFTRFLGDGAKISNEIMISHNRLIEAYSYFSRLREFLEINYDAIYTANGIPAEYTQQPITSPHLQSSRETEVKQISTLPAMITHPNNPNLVLPGVQFIIGNDYNYSTEIEYNNFINLISMISSMTESSYVLTSMSSNTLIEAQNNQIIENQLEILQSLGNGRRPAVSNVNTQVSRQTNTGFNRSNFGGQPVNNGNGITNHSAGGTSLGGRRSSFPMGRNINQNKPLQGAPVQEQPPVMNTPQPTETNEPVIEKTSMDDFANQVNNHVESSVETVENNSIPSMSSIIDEAKNMKFDLDSESVDDLDL